MHPAKLLICLALSGVALYLTFSTSGSAIATGNAIICCLVVWLTPKKYL